MFTTTDTGRESALVAFICDTNECGESHAEVLFGLAIANSVRLSPGEYMPDGWSGVLITSMDDGDYALLLCPKCSDELKGRVTLPWDEHGRNPNDLLVGR